MIQPPEAQTAETMGNGLFFVILVAVNAWTRFRENKKLKTNINSALDEKVAEIEIAAKQLREEIATTRIAMARLEVRIESSEKVDEQVGHDIGHLRVEMHSLSGRVDASNAIYTEILNMAKNREQTKSKVVMEPGTVPDLQDQTRVVIKKKEGA